MPQIWVTRIENWWDAAQKKIDRTRYMRRGLREEPLAQMSTTDWLSQWNSSFLPFHNGPHRRKARAIG